ncbi:MAG: hypothetical protein MEQ07_00875 [Aquimonas sp.]|nr:hypothetical protein [Aquimonas sp.]
MSSLRASEAAPRLDWFASAFGRRLLACEARALQEAGLGARGGRTLVISGSPSAGFALALDAPQRPLQLAFDARRGRLEGGLRAGLQGLPFCRESFGLILLWHLPSQRGFDQLDLGQLAELLLPEGELALVALNPFSAWRLHWQRFGLASPGVGGLGGRLLEAGLELRAARGLGPRWPWATADGLDPVVHSPPLCGSVLLLARHRRPGVKLLPSGRMAPLRMGAG